MKYLHERREAWDVQLMMRKLIPKLQYNMK